MQDIVVSKVGKFSSRLQNVEDKLNEKERCFEKQLDDFRRLNDKFNLQVIERFFYYSMNLTIRCRYRQQLLLNKILSPFLLAFFRTEKIVLVNF